jgi:DNA/RNA endonuclease G (NUC1)
VGIAHPTFLLLNAADPKMKEYVHNLEVIPDWGAFRFDLHVPAAAIGSGNGKLNITIQDSSDPNNKIVKTIYLKNLFLELPSKPGVYNVQGNPLSYDYVSASEQLEQKASVSFETFSINIPDELRGKIATIKLEANNQSGEFLIDNIGFKNNNLKLGNPTDARSATTSGNINQYKNNLLIERPQYAISYNALTNTANWASWELNRDFLQKVPARGGTIDARNFQPDTTLPSEFYQVQTKDYKGADNKSIKTTENGETVEYVYGHLVPVADRNTNWKDNTGINLLSNIVPQTNATNGGVWGGFENYTRRFIKGVNNNKDAYIVAGTYESKNVEIATKGTPGTDTSLNQASIKIPEYLWKVILVVNRPGLEAKDITKDNSYAIGFWMPNTNEGSSSSAWQSKNPDGTYTYLKSVDFIESKTGYNFFSYLATDVQAVLESNNILIEPKDFPNGVALLVADASGDLALNNSGLIDSVTPNRTIWHSGVTEQSTSIVEKTNSTQEIRIGQVGIIKESLFQNGVAEVSSGQVASVESTLPQFGISKVSADSRNIEERNLSSMSTSEIRSIQDYSLHVSILHTSSSQVSPSQVGFSQVNTLNVNSFQVSSTEVGSYKFDVTQISPSKVGSTEIDSTQPSIVTVVQLNPTEVSLPSSVSSQQFFTTNVSHDKTSNLLTNIFSTAQSIWQSVPINLTFELTNLPKGQLAEAQISEFGANGAPTKATIFIDDDANGVGWFLDSTPQDNSEFTGTDTYFQATPNSPASGKYDLLTTILHEMGHTLGIINGYSEFDKYVKGRQFITDTFTANLTPDGSHLDTTFHPYDLMNTSLKPGVRKLPSTLNIAMIDAINSGVANGMSSVATVNPAHLTAGALIGITNGDFTTPTTWNTLGATNIINGTATLTEQSQKLSELTQAFIIPTGAKTLQFTIKDNHLIPGDTTKTANDAFEVALLDTNTFTPLAGTSQGLTNTDSLLNIQANGTIHKSDKVTITALGNNSSIVTIDLTQITPTTQATLYFNLLGFGARTSTVTIDDVKLFTDTQPIPVTNNDTLVTNQNTPLTLTTTQLTTNDTNVTQIQIINRPTHGTLIQAPDGKLTYTPVPTYVGNDSFTYLGFGSDGQISNLATVNLTINNLPPTIETLTIPTKINEGQNIQLSATAKDGGSSDNLTYTWNLGDGSNPITGRNIAHTYTDNGNYEVTLTITWNFDDGTASVTLVGALGFEAQPNLQSYPEMDLR